MLTEALAAMGIDDLELLCQLTGVRPEVADVTGPARVAILHQLDVHTRAYGGA